MSLSSSEIAELMLSVGTHKEERPLSPIEVSERIELLVETYGSKSKVARRLGLKGVDIVNRFLALRSLPPTVKDIIGWKGPKAGELGFDMAYRISTLSNPRDREILAKTAVHESLTKQEIQDIITLNRRNPEKGIEYCIQSSLNIRPIVEVGYALVVEMNPALRNLLASTKGQETTASDLVGNALASIMPPEDIESIRVRSGTVVIILTQNGYDNFSAVADERGVSKKRLLQHLILPQVEER